jgi:lysophospholipase L1-like esterase
MLNVLLFLLTILWPTPAQAQTFPKPPDVPDYVTVTPSWPTGSNPVAVKGPSDTPPANSYELTDIPSTNPTQLRIASGGANFNTVVGFGGTHTEAKFRTHLEPTHILFDDPIRNYGQPGQSHCHLFFGNSRVNAYSTFSALRQNARQYSKAAGGGLNGTGYWMPCMMWEDAFGDGKDYAVLPGAIIVYYAETPSLNTQLKDLPLGLRYVSGFWMDDGGDYMNSVLAAANAAAGYTRYQAINPLDGQANPMWTQHTYTCVGATGGSKRALVNADGSDPWNGTCTAGMPLQILFEGASCWDGVNFWSQGGYKHVIPQLWDTTINKFVCPQNYYRLPKLQLNFSFKHSGWDTSLKYWRLASDGISVGNNTGTVGGKTVRRGETFHTDWFNGWDRTTLQSWLVNCLGVRGNTPHECDSSTISGTEKLISNEANPQTSKNPQVNLGLNNPNNHPNNMRLLPSTSNGPKTIHIHGGSAHVQNKVAIEGDSISVFGAGMYTGLFATSRPAVTPCYLAVSGSGINTGTGGGVVARTSGVTTCNGEVVTLFIGANDLAFAASTQEWLDAVFAYTQALRAQGYKVAVGTVLPRIISGDPTKTALHNSRRAVANAAIRAAVGVKIDAVFDFAANTTIGDDADASNTALYPDGLHPSGTAHSVMVGIYTPVVDTLLAAP